MIIIIINPICIIHNDSFAVCINAISMYSVSRGSQNISVTEERETDREENGPVIKIKIPLASTNMIFTTKSKNSSVSHIDTIIVI